MLPVCGSLREFQELDSSPQDLQSQPRPQQGFSRRSKKTLTKKVAGLICLALFCAGTVFLEYKMLLLFGAAFVAFAAASALAVISGALYRAPEGDERADGLHIRQRNRPALQVSDFCFKENSPLWKAKSVSTWQKIKDSMQPANR
jgi:hypothetical protein